MKASFNVTRKNSIVYVCLTFLLCLLSGIPQVNADFDPVNDDTDIFLANPNVASSRPNVLIYVDNTANWNNAFANEKSALKTVVENLSDLFNVGLMLFPETGNPNDNVDGSYVRFAIRQMTDQNKAVLSSIVNGFNINNDKGNNATTGLGMAEVFRYFSGGKSRASHGKIKTDYASNSTHEATAASLGSHALPANPTSNSNYNTPMADVCQSNFLIYLSNGPANENASASATAQTLLSAAGYNTSSTISLTPNGQQGNWMDEWSKFMANADINPNMDGMQNLTTYVVEVDPGTNNQAAAMTALMKSAALNGNGEYFAVSSGNAGQAIVNALNSIFREIQAVNSVFASTTLPVSVNVRGTNLNQVYIGVFRPDEVKSPRWFGNLKMYQLGFDSATSTLFLADSAGTEAENPETGFINANSASFWTEASTFWNFRTADENGAGGASDLPDGDLVEKGGTAQQQRKAFATDQTTRHLYTCNGSCAAGSLLSATPFDTSNSNITNASLGLGVVSVSTLSGFDTKSASSIVDSFAIGSMNTAAGEVAVTSLTTNAVGKTVTSLTTIATKAITAMSNSPVEKTFNSLNRPSGNPKDPVIAVINNHGYTNGQVVHISGVSAAEYNGSKTITVVDANTFKYSTGTSNPANGPSITSAKATTTSTIVTVTVPAHGLSTGNTVTIAGVTPTDFNGTYTINRISDDQFSFTTASALAPVTSIASATITASSSTATATVANHGYASNSRVVISGSAVAAYNGTHTVTSTGANTFTFPVGASQANDTSGAARSYAGTATVTAAAAGHSFSEGQTVSISGANPSSYNGAFTIFNVVPGVSFQFNAPGSAANTGTSVRAGSGVSTMVTATVPGHKFSFGDVINVSGAVPNDYNGIHTITSIVDDNTFKFVINTSPEPATTPGTIRLNSPTAFATVTAHGYSTGDLITIRGSTPAGYNRNDIGITVVNADTFKYPLAATLGTAATGTLQSLKKGLTAYVRAVNHGFATNDNVGIAGATPNGFNGSFNITKVDDNNFTYTLPSAEGDASGTITASSGSGSNSARTNLINWVRGADNQSDENSNGLATDVRASIQGDVLHSRPAVVNYNRHGNDDDVFVFFGSNDGIFRAVKGGFNQSATGQPNPGQEVWGFIPQEFFHEFERLRNNEPKISSANKKPYFADGTIAVLAEDNSGPDGANVPDGKLDTTVDNDSNPDRVQLFISMRRGGRFIYAIDVSVPAAPRFMWKKSYSDLGMGEFGYSWSAPRVVTLNANNGNPVLMFGAGYDPDVEDVTPADITSLNSNPHTEVTAASAIYTRRMGRGIYALDAATGNILWQAGPAAADPTADPSVTHHFKAVDGMDYAIPSDLTIIKDRNGSVNNRAYVGDTGGNIWRIDMDDSNVANWEVTRLAALADNSELPEGNRKFLFPPDVVYSNDGYDAVLIGSGDREHPFDESVINRFYMIKDPSIGTSVPDTFSTIVESDLFDTTSNCIQDATACSGTGDEVNASVASEALSTAQGWYITMAEGEKIVGNAVTLNNVTFFNTNQPGSAATVADCSSDLGIARQYKVRYDNATAIADQNIDGITDAADRSKIHAGGGYLPSPVPVVVEIDGQIHEGVISGVAVDEPPGSLLNARLRRFWYKEME